MDFLKNKTKGWYVFAASTVCALLFVLFYMFRGGDIFTTVSPLAVILTFVGIALSIVLSIKSIKPLEIVPFVLYFISLLIFLDSEIEFIANVAYGTDGQAIGFAFVAIIVFGFAAVVTGMIASIMKIEE